MDRTPKEQYDTQSIVDSQEENQRPASKSDVIINRSGLSSRKITNDNEVDSRKEQSVDAPKIVETIEKRRAVLTEPRQLGNTSPFKELNKDSGRSPRTLREKKERYLKNASFSRSYLKNDSKLLYEQVADFNPLGLDSMKKKGTLDTSQNKKNWMDTSSSLQRGTETDASSKSYTNMAARTVPSEMKKSDESSNVRPNVQHHPDLLDSVINAMKSYDEKPLNPDNQVKMENEIIPEDSSHPNIPAKCNLQTDRDNKAEDKKNRSFGEVHESCDSQTHRPENTNKTISQDIHSSNRQQGKNQDTIEEVKMQDNKADTVNNVSSESEIDVELQSPSAPTTTCTSALNGKDEVAEFTEKNGDEEIPNASLENSNNPSSKNANGNLQTYLSPSELRSTMERISYDFPTGCDFPVIPTGGHFPVIPTGGHFPVIPTVGNFPVIPTGCNSRVFPTGCNSRVFPTGCNSEGYNTNINQFPLVTNVQQSENRININLEQKNDSNLKKNSKTPEGDNKNINQSPLMTNVQQSENIIETKLEKKNDSNFKENGCLSDSEVENSDQSKILHAISTEIEENAEKIDVEEETETKLYKPNSDGNSSGIESISSSLSISDLQTKDLANLMNDVGIYYRAAVSVLKAEPISVVPNLKFRIPSAVDFATELPGSLKIKYETLNPTLTNQRAAPSSTSSETTSKALTPSSIDRKTPDEEIPRRSSAGQTSDANKSTQVDQDSTERLKNGNDKLLRAMLNENIVNSNPAKRSPEEEVQIWRRQGAVLRIYENYFEIPQYNEVLPDDPYFDQVPDLEDEPMDLEILPDRRRRGGIVYPGIPMPPPQNPAPVPPPQNPAPVPERQPSPDQNQEPAPEAESPADPQPTPTPQPSPEPQEEQRNSEQEEHSTAASKSEYTTPNVHANEEENASSPSDQSGVDEITLKQGTSSPGQEISEPGDLSKYIRQSHNDEVNKVIPDSVIQPSNIQNHVNNSVTNGVHSTEETNNGSIIDEITVHVSPDRKVEPPKPNNPSRDEPKPSSQKQIGTTFNEEDFIEMKVISARPEFGLEVCAAVPLDGVVVDTAPVPDWPNIPDEEPGPMNPFEPKPYDRQNGYMTEAQGNRSTISPTSSETILAEPNKSDEHISERSCEKEGPVLIGTTGRVNLGCRPRTQSLNQPKSPKFKPIYHPGTNNEYASILQQEEIPKKKSLEEVNKPKKNLIHLSRVNQDDHMDIELPFEARADEALMNTMDIPKPVNPPPEIIIERIPSPSQDQDEHTTNIPANAESESVKEETKTSSSGSASNIGVISCTLPSRAEDNTGQDSADSNQQETTESTETSQKDTQVNTSSNIGASSEQAAVSQNLGGSGSDDDEDENTQKRTGVRSNEPQSDCPELEREEEAEEQQEEAEQQQGGSQQQENKPESNIGELEPRALLTRSKSDESAPRMEEKMKLARTLSKSNEGTISCSKEEQVLNRSSESSGEEYLQPIQNTPGVMEEPDDEAITVEVNSDEEPSQGSCSLPCSDNQSENEPESVPSSTKRKEPPTPEIPESGPNKLLAREDGSGRRVSESHEPEEEQIPVIRPARITQRRQPVSIESDISDLDRGLSESGISEVDGSSDRDASAGEGVSETEDYTARRRLTRNQAAQIEAHQPRPGISMISSEYDGENSSPSPEPPAARTAVVFNHTGAYSDSGSTIVPQDSASSVNASEHTLSSNMTGEAERADVAGPSGVRQIPSLNDLNLPQDAEYADIQMVYYRRRPTSDPLTEVLEILESAPPSSSDKRKRSSPADKAETKKIKTEESEGQCSSSGVDQDGDVPMLDVNPEEPISDSDREVEAIMACQPNEEESVDNERNIPHNMTRDLCILMPHDNIGRIHVLVYPPRSTESSFVPYVPPNKVEKPATEDDSLDSSKPEDKDEGIEEENTESGEPPKDESMETTEEESNEPPKEESTEPPKEESTEPPKEESTEPPKEESTEPPKEESAEPTEEQSSANNRRSSLGFSKQESSSRRATLRKRESLEPPPKKSPLSTKSSSSSSFKKDAGSSTLKPNQKGTTTRSKPWNSTKTTLTQNKPTEPSQATRRSISDTNKGGGSCKEAANKKTQRDDKEDPDSSSKGKNSGRRQTRSPVKKPTFRR